MFSNGDGFGSGANAGFEDYLRQIAAGRQQSINQQVQNGMPPSQMPNQMSRPMYPQQNTFMQRPPQMGGQNAWQGMQSGQFPSGPVPNQYYGAQTNPQGDASANSLIARLLMQGGGQ